MAAALGLAALTLALFPRVVFRGEVLYERDIHLVWQPQMEAFVRSILSGSWPVWNPYLSFGHPLLAKPDTQVLYPWTWLNLVLQPWTVHVLLVLGHVAFAGLGVHLLGRRLGLSPLAAFVAAACWIGSGPVLSLGNIWVQLTGASWIPWVLLGVERAAVGTGVAGILAGGTAIGLQVLTGSPEMTALTALAAASLLTARVAGGDTSGAPITRLIARTACAYLFGLALSAGLWVPALDLARQSARGHLDIGQRVVWSVHPWSLLEGLVPVPLSVLPIRQALRDRLYDGGQPLIRSLYLGAPALLLVAAGLARGPFGWRRPWLGALGLAAALLALGRHALVHAVLVEWVPPLRMLRYPSKAIVFAALAWALLAGLGLDNWRRQGAAVPRRLFAALVLPAAAAAALLFAAGLIARYRPASFHALLLPEETLQTTLASVLGPVSLRLLAVAALGAVAVLAAVLARARPRLGGALPTLLCAVVVADAVVSGHDVNKTVPADFYKYRPPILDAVRQDDLSRLFVYRYPLSPAPLQPGPALQEPYRIRGYPPGFSLDAGRTLAARLYLMPPVGGCFGLFASYEPDLLGLYPRPLAELTEWALAAEGTPDHLRFLRLGAVKYVSALHAQGFEALEPVAEYQSLLARPIRLFEVPATLPRVYVVGRSRSAAEGEGLRRALLDPSFDPSREVVVAGPPLAGGPAPPGSARIVDFRPDRVRIEADMSAPGILVLVDTYEAGWKAAVDGVAAPVLRANGAFRGVALSPGRHLVEQVYRPRSVVAGLGLTALAAALGLALGARALSAPAGASR